MLIESIPRAKPHLRWIRFVLAALCAVVLMKLWGDWAHYGFDWSNAWLPFTFAAVGLSALVEGIYDDRPHLLISAWQLHVIAAGFLASYAAGAAQLVGTLGFVMLGVGLLLAVVGTLRGGTQGTPVSRPEKT